MNMLTEKEIKILNYFYRKLKGKHLDGFQLILLIKNKYRLTHYLAFKYAYLYNKYCDQANEGFGSVTNASGDCPEVRINNDDLSDLNRLYEKLGGEKKTIRELTYILKNDFVISGLDSIRKACLYYYNYDQVDKNATDHQYFNAIQYAIEVPEHKLILEYLNNGKERGYFKTYLDSLKDSQPNILWYPSAGDDLDSLIYLSKPFTDKHNLSNRIPVEPDLFLFTDLERRNHNYGNANGNYHGFKMKYRVIESENLDNLDFTQYQNLGIAEQQEVKFYMIEIISEEYGVYKCPVLYISAENGSFLKNFLLSYKVKVSHVIHKNWGMAARSRGAWLPYALNQLNCQLYIVGENYTTINRTDTDNYMFGMLDAYLERPALEEIANDIDGIWYLNNGINININASANFDKGYRPITNEELERLS